MSGGGESLSAYVHPELADCAKAVSTLLCCLLVVRISASTKEVLFLTRCFYWLRALSARLFKMCGF